MVSLHALAEYRTYIEYRLLLALEKRSIEYRGDVTRVITEAVSDLGNHLGFSVTLEKRYHPVLADARNHRCDVHWHGEVDHIWEIDRTLKEVSANKLMAAREPEKMWVLWAKDGDLIGLRLMDLAGINVILLNFDIRKLIWDRLLSEKFHRMELQNALSQEERYLQAKILDGRIRPDMEGPRPGPEATKPGPEAKEPGPETPGT